MAYVGLLIIHTIYVLCQIESEIAQKKRQAALENRLENLEDRITNLEERRKVR